MPGRVPRWIAATTLSLCSALCQAGPDFDGKRASDDARLAASWVQRSGDNQGRSFAIVDKRDARIYVFDASGRLKGASATLLGIDRGDNSVPDVAGRTPASLGVGERTTPAGRFESEPGHNDRGEDIVWFDYDASLAIHRLRPAKPQERRPGRLASATAEDKRISLGCIIVPVAFYEAVVRPSLGTHGGVVYVLPETRPVAAMFDALDIRLSAR